MQKDTVQSRVPTRALLLHSRPRAVVIAGPPGAGKDTQCNLLEESTGGLYQHIAIGNMFRKAVENNTPFGQKIKSYLEHDDFVPDEMVTAFVFDMITETNKLGKIPVLNGFPRTPQQSYNLHVFAEVLAFILVDVDEQECARRLASRLCDPLTDKVYDEKALQDKTIRDRFVQRPGDRDQEKVQIRIETFKRYISGVVHYFVDVFHFVDGSRARERVRAAISRKLDKPTAIQPSFCECKLRVATHINVPCGHNIWCSTCIKQRQVAAQPAGCTSCGETVERFIASTRYTHDSDSKKNIQLCASLCSPVQDDAATVAIDVKIADATERPRISVVVVMDTSGSMKTEAVFEQDNTNISAGCSLLNDIKDPIRTLVESLLPEDNFGLVTFSTKAQIWHELQPMTSNAKQHAIQAIQDMIPSGTTNIWEGLEFALEMLEKQKGRTAILFLTDGQPTKGSGFLDAITCVKAYCNQHPIIPQVHFFGLGSDLEPGYLLQLAEVLNGTYTFLSDCSTVPAAFVRAIANVGSICVSNSKLHLRAIHGATFADQCVRNLPPHAVRKQTQTCLEIDYGALHYGQTKSLVLDMELPEEPVAADDHALRETASQPFLAITLESDGATLCTLQSDNLTITPDAIVALARAEFVTQTRIAVCNETKANVAIQLLQHRLQQMTTTCNHPFLKMLLDDAAGRVAKGCDPTRYHKWGQHYIAALMRAHTCHLRTNGMDHSLLMYGGTLSDAFETTGRVMYNEYKQSAKSAPNVPTVAVHVAAQPQYQQYQHSSLQMDCTYSRGGGGCFGADCIIIKQGVGPVRMCDVHVGDYVQTSNGYSQIMHKICIPQPTRVVKIGELVITPTHPVRARNSSEWCKPSSWNIGAQVVNRVYNVILADEGVHLAIANYECVVWGHNVREPDVFHNFYGNRATLLRDLAHIANENKTYNIHIVRDTNDHAIALDNASV